MTILREHIMNLEASTKLLNEINLLTRVSDFLADNKAPSDLQYELDNYLSHQKWVAQNTVKGYLESTPLFARKGTK